MNKIFKNRIVIAIGCIILALLLLLLYANFQKSEAIKTKVVRVKSTKESSQGIQKGELISSDMLELVTVGGYNLSSDVATSIDEVANKYALADLSVDEIVLKKKVASQIPASNDKLLQLDGSQVAFSITIKSFASGLSDKLQSGDIVSVVIGGTDIEPNIPEELTYVEVLMTTYDSGADKEKDKNIEDETLATVTLLVTPQQAIKLKSYEDNAEMALALVYRGDEETSKSFLKKQSEVLQNEKTDTDNRQ